MKNFVELGKKIFAGLPLFFQVFALACSLMFPLAVYGFLIEAFTEARIFLYTATGYLIFALINLATANRNLKDWLIQFIFDTVFLTLPIFLAFYLDYFAKY